MIQPAEPKLEYLLRTNPEIMRQEHIFMAGEEVTFGTPNDKLLRQRVLEHGARGREALKAFTAWLVRHEGYPEKSARLTTALVWDALCITWDAEHGSQPWKVLDDTRYRSGARNAFMGALRRWATYSKDADLFNELMARKGVRAKSRVVNAPKPSTITFLTAQQMNRLLKAADQFQRNPQAPWAYAIMRIVLLTGANLQGLMHVTRDQAKAALHEPMLACWTRLAVGPQAIPSVLIRPELQGLLDLPWDWGTLADVVDPVGQSPITAAARVTKTAKELYALARVPMSAGWIRDLRWTCAARYYKASKNLVGCLQILGPKMSPALIRDRLGVRTRGDE